MAIVNEYNDRPTQFFPCEDVALVVWGNKVTGDKLELLWFHASKEGAHNYLLNQKKNKCTGKQCEEVDWENIDLTLKNKADMYKI